MVLLCIDSRISVECSVIMSPKSDLAQPTATVYTKGIIKALRGCRDNSSESDDEGFKYRNVNIYSAQALEYLPRLARDRT